MMNSTQYKEYHESFMQNNHGSSAMHTCLFVYFTLQCTLLCAIKQSKVEVSNMKKCIREYLNIILPMILVHTILSDCIFIMNITVFSFLLHEMAINYNKIFIQETLSASNIFKNNRIQTITCLRGLTYLITGFCILAVDFKDFPRYLAKTENYGYSLMDTGVGLFVLISGLVHSNVNMKNYNTFRKNIYFILILLTLGITRYMSVKQLDYQEHVTEYGVHWNFFYTLAICKLLSSFLLFLYPQPLLLSILIILVHEFLLYNSLEEWVFSDTQRINLIDANREGISSSLGYVALYLYAVHLRKVLSKTSIRYYILRNLLLTSALLFTTSLAVNNYRPISRTLANLGYCTYISTVLTFGVTVMYLLEVLFQYKLSFKMPVILAAINNNGLMYFLVANLSTGVVNLSFRTLLLSSASTFVILNCYMIFTICLIFFMNKIGIRF